jgi:hypothetical protein
MLRLEQNSTKVEDGRPLVKMSALKRVDEAAKKWLTGSGEDNVIHVEKQVGSLCAMMVDEQRRAWLGLHEAQCHQERSQSRVPRPGGLLEAVEGPVEPADHVRARGVHEPHRLTAVGLGEGAVQEGVLVVERVNWPAACASRSTCRWRRWRRVDGAPDPTSG